MTNLTDTILDALTETEAALTEANRRLVDTEIVLAQTRRRADAAEANERRLNNDLANLRRHVDQLVRRVTDTACDRCLETILNPERYR